MSLLPLEKLVIAAEGNDLQQISNIVMMVTKLNLESLGVKITSYSQSIAMTEKENSCFCITSRGTMAMNVALVTIKLVSDEILISLSVIAEPKISVMSIKGMSITDYERDQNIFAEAMKI